MPTDREVLELVQGLLGEALKLDARAIANAAALSKMAVDKQLALAEASPGIGDPGFVRDEHGELD